MTWQAGTVGRHCLTGALSHAAIYHTRRFHISQHGLDLEPRRCLIESIEYIAITCYESRLVGLYKEDFRRDTARFKCRSLGVHVKKHYYVIESDK